MRPPPALQIGHRHHFHVTNLQWINRLHEWKFTKMMPDKHFNPDRIEKNSITQATHGVMITSFLRENDAVTSFWRDNAAIFTSYARWGMSLAEQNNVYLHFTVSFTLYLTNKKQAISTSLSKPTDVDLRSYIYFHYLVCATSVLHTFSETAPSHITWHLERHGCWHDRLFGSGSCADWCNSCLCEHLTSDRIYRLLHKNASRIHR